MVGVNAVIGADMNAFGGRPMNNMSGTCFYCFNRNPECLLYKFRNQCPWYLDYRAKGVCYLNSDNKLCLGPEREGAPTIFLVRGTPQGT
jgi:hypothetical protein